MRQISIEMSVSKE
jgi:hypothetical protein